MQAILIFAVSTGYADKIIPENMEDFEKKLYKYFTEEKAELTDKVKTAEKFDNELKNELSEAIGEFAERF